MVYDTIIIGSGPAGLSAAIYAVRAKLHMLVLEQNYISGGQVVDTYEVDNYPGLMGITGMELGQKLREHAEKLGAEFLRTRAKKITKTEDGNWMIECKKETYETKTVILATGAHHRKLEVPGEEEYAGMGVSYCATCDGAFYKGREVVVVGGGDVALEDAIFLARVCKKVYLVHRRDKLRGAKILQEKLLSLPNVELILESVVIEIKGEDQVQCVQVEHVREKTRRIFNVDGIFIAVGIVPDSGLAQELVALDEGGYVKSDETGKTSMPGIFVAGDVRTKQLRQIVTAAADGANAIASVEQYLVTRELT